MSAMFLKSAIILSAMLLIFAVPAPSLAQETGHIYCGKSLRAIALFDTPKTKSSGVASVQCDEVVTILSRQGDWIKLRTQKGITGFTSRWFVDLRKDAPAQKGNTCNRPTPFGNKEQFMRIHTALVDFIGKAGFSKQDFEMISEDDIEETAASSYSLAYLTAEKPGKAKGEVFKGVIDNQSFGKAFSNLSPEQQIYVQIWMQKLLNVMSKAFDLGYADGAMIPCQSD